MKKRLFLSLVMLMALVFVLTGSPTPNTEAHEHRQVDKYEITFGWRVEPAYVGLFNGPEIQVVELAEEGEHEEDEEGEEEHQEGADDHAEAASVPVEGLEETLTLEVTFGEASRVIELRPAFGDPGHYIAELIPTRPGDYVFHLTGDINGVEIDETFDSSVDNFSTVEPAADIMFPDEEMPTIADLQAQIDELYALIEELRGE
ncbi:MAG: hypothetical protein L0154_13920 [Chloroflexi bacterium]|nr:hypothetical protein [Chloroflexota bacterium]